MSSRISLVHQTPDSTAHIHGCASPNPLLDPMGASIILGDASKVTLPAAPIAPAPDTLFGPRGALLVAKEGPLVVCDTGHHRLMIWTEAPAGDGMPADLVIGQPHFHAEGRNAGAEAGASALNVPTGIAAGEGVLAVADAWNHRVLLWHGMPTRPNQPADVVIGQVDFTSVLPNRGMDAPRADTLNWCFGVGIHLGRLYVADTGNRRVLVWNEIPEDGGVPADLVLGQRDFATRDEAAGDEDPALGMRWPHAITVTDGRLLVADAGHSRIMGWNRSPTTNGEPCDFVLGQLKLCARDHNAGEYLPSAASLNMPYGLCTSDAQVVVADTANSRLLGFDPEALSTGQPATCLAGQLTFAGRGDNRWKPAARDSLCWPFGITACGTTLVIADSGNNRVLLWDFA